ncbi:unnamed protein product, partial [Laminaria digitata]
EHRLSESLPRALILSAYDATSHSRWHEGLRQALRTRCQWTCITLPPRHFGWRARGNAIGFLAPEHRKVITRAPWDLVIATSITDLATLRGLFTSLHGAYTILYAHENQFAYPVRDAQSAQNAIHHQVQNILSAACADELLFNSRYNLDTTLDGAEELLGRMPDEIPADFIASLREKASVLPVGIDDTLQGLERPERDEREPVHLLWNHRWEYDKAPERVFRALERLVTRHGRGEDFVLHVVGQRFASCPAIFDEIRDSLGAQIKTWGYLPSRRDYEDLLARCDVVLSSALHEFQGLSMLEALAAGARAVAPDRLVYPEYLPEEDLYDSHPDDPEAEVEAIVAHLLQLFDD